MSSHHSDQMSQWSQVSRIALCMSKVKVSESVSQWVTRSPIELFWTAKNKAVKKLFRKYLATVEHILPVGQVKIAREANPGKYKSQRSRIWQL